MKPLRYTFSALLFSIITIFQLSSQTMPLKDGFYIGTFNWAFSGYYRTQFHYTGYHELGFNMMQTFDLRKCDTDRVNYFGGFFDALGLYQTNVMQVINSWSDAGYNTRSLFVEREKIIRPAYGQRSTYQTEYSPSDLTSKIIRPGYGFELQPRGQTYTEGWQGETVSGRKCCISCPETSPNAGYIVKQLYENREQVNHYPRGATGNDHNHSYYLSDRKKDPYRWYIKPRMRVDSVYAKNNQTTPVVAIITKNYDGGTVDSIVIKCNNFLEFIQGVPYYNGKYIERFFNFQDTTLTVLADVLLGSLPETSADNPLPPVYVDSKVDYQIYWFGQVDVWLDYVRVDDEWAHYLFEQDPNHNYDFVPKIQEEVNAFSTNSVFAYFYMDEFQYTSLPCIAEVNRLIKAQNSNTALVPIISDWWLTRSSGLKNPPEFSDAYNFLLGSGAVTDILLTDIYPFDDVVLLPHNVTLPDAGTYPGTSRYVKASNSSLYNDSLQKWLEHDQLYPITPNLQLPCIMDKYRKLAGTIKNRPGIVFSLGPQTMAFENFLVQDPNGEVSREPTMEEISVQAYIGLAYGARQLMYFLYPTNAVEKGNTGTYYYDWGMVGVDQSSKRTSNYYGQPKWNGIASLDTILHKTGGFMYNTNKFTYDTTATVNTFPRTYSPLPCRYISDLASYYRDINSGDFPSSNTDPSGKKYWEIGFFNNPDENLGYKYFLLLNKRCTPDYNQQGDARQVRLYFNRCDNDMAEFDNWELRDVITNQKVVFDINNTGGVLLPMTFAPGEGRLLRLAPVMKTGGTLVTDESFGGVSFTCKDTVLNDGKNITITGTNSSISFTDSATIIMTGGTFQSSTSTAMSGPGNKNIFQGSNSHKWGGLRFNGSIVKIYDAKFLDISSPAVNHSVKMLNCPLGDIRNNIFTMNTDTSGAVHSVYTSSEDVSYSLYVNYNTITMNNSRTNAIQVQGFSGLTMPLYANSNTMTSNGYATGIMLSTITGGVINENSITGFATGINTLFSTVDMFGNYVTNTASLSDGVLAADGSFLNMTNNGSLVIGGMNTFTNTYDGASVNMHLVNSLFEMEEGTNIFDITSTANLGAYHIYGTFPEVDSYNPNQLYNCFKFDGLEIEDPDLPVYDVIMGGNPVTLNFIPYQCWAPSLNGNTIVDIGNGLYDTIPNVGGGEGGSYSSVKKKLIIANAKTLFDSISIQIRYRDYEGAKDNCYELIENYPDSIQSLEVLSTLYLSVISSDTTTSAMTELITFYENLILNNSGNAQMVTNSNYLIQKCKVRLRQYQSALSGFQQIINNNPYSYLGLLARWDYMATSLLIGGQGGAFRGESEEGDDDKSPLSKEQRKIIKGAVTNINEINKNNSEIKIKKLEEKSEAGDVGAVKELKTIKILKEVNKSHSPKDLFEHITIVNNDIQTVFSKDIIVSSKQNKTVPAVFRISQNYPNPFNPVTKINYDLPKDSKVNIVIYDILGREVKRLLNNEIKQAGSYIVDFNAMNYASGVYFYRIEAEEPNGNKFVDSKKMVLLK